MVRSRLRRRPNAEHRSVAPMRTARTRLAVLVEQRGDAGERLLAGLAVNDLARLEHGHREQPVPAAQGGVVDRVQEGGAVGVGELGQDEPGQHPDVVAEALRDHRHLLGVADADEDERAVGVRVDGGLPGGEQAELGDDVGAGGGLVGVADRVLEAQHAAHDARGGLPGEVGGQGRAGGRHVERRAKGHGLGGQIALPAEGLRFPGEEPGPLNSARWWK